MKTIDIFFKCGSQSGVPHWQYSIKSLICQDSFSFLLESLYKMFQKEISGVPMEFRVVISKGLNYKGKTRTTAHNCKYAGNTQREQKGKSPMPCARVQNTSPVTFLLKNLSCRSVST